MREMVFGAVCLPEIDAAFCDCGGGGGGDGPGGGGGRSGGGRSGGGRGGGTNNTQANISPQTQFAACVAQIGGGISIAGGFVSGNGFTVAAGIATVVGSGPACTSAFGSGGYEGGLGGLNIA